MPQWRKLHTNALDSLDIDDMPDDFTRLFWLLMPLALDREGRMIDHTTGIRSKVFPLREDVTTEMIENALSWFAARGMIIRYEVEERRYLQATKFREDQGDNSREAESKIPAPSEEILTYSGPTLDLLKTQSGTDVDVDIDIDADVDSGAGVSEPPPEKPVRELMFDALVETCNVADVTKPFRGWANAKIKKLLADNKTPQDVLAFRDYWLSNDWRRENQRLGYQAFSSRFDTWLSQGRPMTDNGRPPPCEQRDDPSQYIADPIPSSGSLWGLDHGKNAPDTS